MKLLPMAMCSLVCATAFAHDQCCVVKEVSDDFGEFEGKVTATWDDNGRDMTLETDFVYVDPRGKKWLAPKNSTIDGASIPQIFWSVIGGPYEGKYRNASVVHDVACEEKTEKSQDVHRMFYEACRRGDVDECTAKWLYWAVYYFGPTWEYSMECCDADGELVSVPTIFKRRYRQPNKCDVQKARRYFQTHHVTLDEIETLTPEKLACGHQMQTRFRRGHRRFR